MEWWWWIICTHVKWCHYCSGVVVAVELRRWYFGRRTKVNELAISISSDLFAETEMCSLSTQPRRLLSGRSWQCHAPTAYQVRLSILSLIMPSVNIPEVMGRHVMDEI